MSACSTFVGLPSRSKICFRHDARDRRKLLTNATWNRSSLPTVFEEGTETLANFDA
jgi:hypothetical protein